MLIVFIRSNASIPRRAFAESWSLNNSGIMRGTTCQERPYLSLSQLYCWACGSHGGDLRVLEYRDVECGCLFGLMVEPQA
jgi:hypothetical protein